MKLELEGDWVVDGDTASDVQLLRVKRTLVSRRTRYQQLEIVDTEAYGRTLLLDGQVQSSERDEFLYHEALVHPALLLHASPHRVLILGGGEGATLREVLAHRSVREAHMVDIDREVVAACREHLPMFSRGSFEDPRTRLVFDDARAELERSEQSFDVIVQDVTDPAEAGPAAALFEPSFFELVQRRLAPGGLFVVQCGSASVTQLGVLAATLEKLRSVFGGVAPYLTTVPSFAAPWSFALAATTPIQRLTAGTWNALLAARLARPCQALDGETIAALFALGPHLRRALGGAS